MKIFENTCHFYYPWDQVTAANWNKYPNEVSTHVIAVDVLRRELDPSRSILTTERLITCKQKIPNWLLVIIGGTNVSYVREVSVVDMNEKTLTLRSVNLTWNNLLRVFETVTYKPDSTDPYRTVFTQEAQITAYASFQRLCNKIEEWSVQTFRENAKKGKAGFESVLEVFNEKWENRNRIVDDISGSLDKVKKSVDDSIELVKGEFVKETDKLISEADQVKKSILTEYYDNIKYAFKKDH